MNPTEFRCWQRTGALAFAVAATLAAAQAAAQTQSPAGDLKIIDQVIVTAQKRSESIQDVPIAVSAFTAADLTSRGMDGGKDILQAIPNVSFSKSQYTSFNLQVRGIGSKLIGISGDQGVGIHVNNVPLGGSRFFEAEFYDIERIELLRGPQGTLYGRNSTGGVFNAITAKPTDEFASTVTLDVGNYNSRRAKAMLNLPLNDVFQFRIAGSYLKRDGFVYDLAHDTDIDGRELAAGRATLAFQPTESFRGFLMYEHFDENDDRQRSGKQLCTKDDGPASVAGLPTTQSIGGQQVRFYLSQGCKPGSLYSPAAFNTTNSNGSLGGMLANLLGLSRGDVNAGKVVSRNLRHAESAYLPKYKAQSDIAELNLEFDLSDTLSLTSLTSYNEDFVRSFQDYNRAIPSVPFNSPIPDPQLGLTDRLSVADISAGRNLTWTQELRLQSQFDGPWNFNFGAIYVRFDTPQSFYYVFFNSATALSFIDPRIYRDPNFPPSGDGHNYYFNRQEYQLRSTAAFGELYWQMSDAFKWTLGLRYTDDEKTATNFPIQMLEPGRGFPTVPVVAGDPSTAINEQSARFKETTGRFGFDWEVGEDSLVYAFYSKGYKGGGFNPSAIGNLGVKKTFDPEFVNAIEIGTKNRFADGRVQLNANVFHYDYEGYQVSRIVNLTAVNDNIDAKIYGAELEFIWQPFDALRLDGNVGYLQTEIQNGASVDVMNRTQGNPALSVVKGTDSGTNCVVPTAGLATFIGALNAQLPVVPDPTAPGGVRALRPTDMLGACSGAFAAFGMTPSDGIPVQLEGKELPNSPHWTFNLGAQTSFDLNSSWRGTLRGDFYHQTETFSRMYNSEFDRLRDWSNVNVSLGVDNEAAGWNVLMYVKNVLNDDNISDAFLTDDSSGLWSNTFLTDPRMYGVSLTKRF
jgi:outer membrane receptor protein involved in Fe transport